jgi:prepilin-type N-terminal cleavage/methylation domain-containing protein
VTKRFHDGFTLIEICLALIVLGALLALAVPNLSKTYRIVEFKKAADDAAFLMRYAQSRAVEEKKIYRFRLDNDRRHYWIERADTDEDGLPGEFERIRSTMGRTLKFPASVGIGIEGDPIQSYPDGTISKGRLLIQGANSRWVVSSMEQRGYVVVYEEQEEDSGVSVN